MTDEGKEEKHWETELFQYDDIQKWEGKKSRI